ncbi:hypothetical protein [Myxosarcina sp. GI1(2024)]
MTELTTKLSVEQTLSLIKSYDFDLGKYSIEQLLQKWLNDYHIDWIRLATIEALYLGRYKAISIEQILSVWFRRGNPSTHFTHEFERLICRNLPRHLSNLTDFSTQENKPRETFSASLNDSRDPRRLSYKTWEKPPLQTQSSKAIAPQKPTSSMSPATSPTPKASQRLRHDPRQGSDKNSARKPPVQRRHRQNEWKSSSANQNASSKCSSESIAVGGKKDSPQTPLPAQTVERNLVGSSENGDRSKPQSSQLNSEPADLGSFEATSKPSANDADNQSALTNSSSKSLVPTAKISEETSWTEIAAEATPIDRFVPLPDVSAFYNKLKAFGQEKLEEQ